MPQMRAKLRVTSVNDDTYDDKQKGSVKHSERVTFCAVSKSEAYPEDGSDEDNTYAKWSPDATLAITIANPNLFGQHEVGQKYYVDFTLVEEQPVSE
jgi:hypothetical protein